MRFSQLLRARLIGLVSMALLFSQIAVAAYACLAMGDRVNRAAADRMAMAGMPLTKRLPDRGNASARDPASSAA